MSDPNEACQAVMQELSTITISDAEVEDKDEDMYLLHDSEVSDEIPQSILGYLEASKRRVVDYEEIIPEDLGDLTASRCSVDILKDLPFEKDPVKLNELVICVENEESNSNDTSLIPEPIQTETETEELFTYNMSTCLNSEGEVEGDEYLKCEKRLAMELKALEVSQKEDEERRSTECQAEREKQQQEQKEKEERRRRRERDFKEELSRKEEAEKLHQIEFEMIERRAQEELQQELLQQQELNRELHMQVEEERRAFEEAKEQARRRSEALRHGAATTIQAAVRGLLARRWSRSELRRRREELRRREEQLRRTRELEERCKREWDEETKRRAKEARERERRRAEYERAKEEEHARLERECRLEEERRREEEERRREEEERKTREEEERRRREEEKKRREEEERKTREEEERRKEEKRREEEERKTREEEERRKEEKRREEEERKTREEEERRKEEKRREEEERKTREEEERRKEEKRREEEERKTREEEERRKEEKRREEEERKTREEEERRKEEKRREEEERKTREEEERRRREEVRRKKREEDSTKREEKREKEDSPYSVPAGLPDHTEQRRLSWMRDCTPWSKLALQNRRRRTGSTQGRRGARRGARGGSLPPLCPDTLLQSGGWRSLREVTTVSLKDLPGCSLSTLAQCVRLQSLTLRRCGLKALEGLGQCPELCYIDVQENDITFVDCENLSNLRVLRLGHNQLTSIHGLGGAVSLDVLELSYNSITRIAGLESVKRLQRLSVDHNQLISTRGLREVYTLLRLDCSHNHLTRVEGLENCALLSTLDLRANNLTEPPSLDNQVLLTELLLDDNSICSLRSLADCWLPLMQRLSAAHNSITQLPSMSHCVSLVNLHLGHNCLSELGSACESLEGCLVLQELHLAWNPLEQESSWRSTLRKAVPGLRVIDGQEINTSPSPPVGHDGPLPSGSFLAFCRAQLQQTHDLEQRHSRESSGASSLLHALKLSCQYYTDALRLAEDQRYAHEYGDTAVVRPETLSPGNSRPHTVPPLGLTGASGGDGTSEEEAATETPLDTQKTRTTGPEIVSDGNVSTFSSHSSPEKEKATCSRLRKTPRPRKPDLRNTAAAVIQQRWRRHRQRCVSISSLPTADSGGGAASGPAHLDWRILDPDHAATVIQALWRGYTLRKRLASALALAAAACPDAGEEEEGFRDSRTALLMLKRAQKMTSKKRRQQKLQIREVEAGLRRAGNVEQVRLNQERTHQWLRTQAARSDRRSASDRFLPEINSDILNGGRVQLVAGPGYRAGPDQAVGLQASSSSVSQPRKENSHPQRNSWRKTKEIPSPSRVTSSPSRKERISFRDNPVQMSSGWGGGKKRSKV
ncbi:leucine-rich repeat- and IQ domain-containing protein 1 [Polymixia lowei]